MILNRFPAIYRNSSKSMRTMRGQRAHKRACASGGDASTEGEGKRQAQSGRERPNRVGHPSVDRRFRQKRESAPLIKCMPCSSVRRERYSRQTPI
ncbi:hypothetical protein C6Q28_06445 [Burkholderia multivorans]|nr:hypothetical protein C6Q28_06445 [Burkholderia multivorans]